MTYVFHGETFLPTGFLKLILFAECLSHMTHLWSDDVYFVNGALLSRVCEVHSPGNRRSHVDQWTNSIQLV